MCVGLVVCVCVCVQVGLGLVVAARHTKLVNFSDKSGQQMGAVSSSFQGGFGGSRISLLHSYPYGAPWPMGGACAQSIVNMEIFSLDLALGCTTFPLAGHAGGGGLSMELPSAIAGISAVGVPCWFCWLSGLCY